MTPVGSGQPHRFFFVHMMKTAGSAFRRRLINHFGERAVYPAGGLDRGHPVRLYLSVDDLRERLAARGEEIEVITGHFPLRATEELPGSFTTLTLLRDPVERTLSYLRQQQADDPVSRFLGRGLPGASRFARSPLDEIYDGLDGMGQTHNHMTRMLSLTPAELLDSMLAPAKVDRHHLERAKASLLRIDAVGFQEHFEGFCDEVSTRFGWRLGEPEAVNVTPALDAAEALRARIAEDNAFDVELYEFAAQLPTADRAGARA